MPVEPLGQTLSCWAASKVRVILFLNAGILLAASVVHVD